LVVLLIGGYAGDWAWTGFGDNDTLWDWLHLLLLPVAIATIPVWLRDREHLDLRIRRLIVATFAAFVVLVALGYLVPLDWTGFEGNTLWDWLGLTLLPFALATVRLWPDLQPRVLRRHMVAALAVAWILVALILFGYLRPWEWTGFTGNTLWDWINLVLAPLLLPLVLMPFAMGYIRAGVDERRAEAEGGGESGENGYIEDPAAAIGRAVTVATVSGPKAGLALLESLQAGLDDDYRLAAARAHLLEMAGHEWDAVADYRAAAQQAPNRTDERYLLAQASRLTEQLERPL
jgi:heme/copper-type cytochrome/quinol oxidase subunit 4